MEQVILVNEHDEPLGFMEKMEAHEKGLLHRAFSIFIFNTNGEMLLQQRAFDKYHSGGLWTNACCSHPRPGETVTEAAVRRLKEEMGFEVPLYPAFHFIYHSVLDKGLTEHELDYVFIGWYDGQVLFNKTEVASYLYKNLTQIEKELEQSPQEFTAWFKIIFRRVVEWYRHSQTNQTVSI
jgi:isopentenyl-diphosphate delta-isomerase